MRLGFTTNIFASPLRTGEVNLGGLVELAEEEGFSSIEVRDDEVAIPFGELTDFVKDAGGQGIEVSYAVKNDMFHPDDRSLLQEAVQRAALCGEGTVLRVLASPSALAATDKKGYTAEELERVVATARDYAAIARDKEVSLALENTCEPLYGDGETWFGLNDILRALENTGEMPGNLGLTFDPANAVFKSLCRAPAEPGRVLEFLSEHKQYVALVHYKTTKGGEVTPVITDGDINNENLFEELAKGYDGAVCVEIPPAHDLTACRENLEASLDYLRKMGLIGYFAQKGRG
ncbi:MAG: sugar phosphate isomerase/epimerase family protein [Planctomycetota bacterium]|jgi:sugar phosphate isomerase/epimerase